MDRLQAILQKLSSSRSGIPEIEAETVPSLEVTYLNRAFASMGLGGSVELGSGANYGMWVVRLQNPSDESTARSVITESCRRLGIPMKNVVVVPNQDLQTAA